MTLRLCRRILRFYPYCINESNKQDSEIKTSETLVQFKVQIMRFTKVNKCSAFNLRDPISK